MFKNIYGMIVCVIPLLLHKISSLRPPKSVEVELENLKYIYNNACSNFHMKDVQQWPASVY